LDATEIHDDVPKHAKAPSLADTTPAPTAAVAPSPAPITTDGALSRPSSEAASLRIAPITVVDGTISGSIVRGTFAAANISSDQFPLSWSNALVPEASDGSVTQHLSFARAYPLSRVLDPHSGLCESIGHHRTSQRIGAKSGDQEFHPASGASKTVTWAIVA